MQKKSFIFLFFVISCNLFFNYKFQLHYDESYYWVFSQNLDFSYYDHPPMIAILIKLSSLLFNGEFAVRFVSFFTTTLTCFMIYKLAKFLFNANIANNALILILSLPLIQGIYFITTPDSPLFMFSSFTLYFFAKWVFDKKNKSIYCYLSAICLGLALLSKYTAILLLLSLVLFLILSKQHRRLLWQRDFIISMPIVFVIFMPVIFWNYSHNWISFKFQLHHGIDLTQKFNLACLLDYITSQVAITGILMLPILIFFIVKNNLILINNDKLLFLLTPFLFVLFFFASRSLFQYMEGNWPGIAYLTGVILLAYIIESINLRWVLNYYIVLIAIILIICKFPIYFYPNKLRNFQPFGIVNNFYGNKELINAVGQYLNNKDIILACDYGNASEIWFYLKHRVYVLNNFKFANQYKFWNDNLDLKNNNVYYICNNDDIQAMDNLKLNFSKINLISINNYNNKVGTKKIYLYKAEDFRKG